MSYTKIENVIVGIIWDINIYPVIVFESHVNVHTISWSCLSSFLRQQLLYEVFTCFTRQIHILYDYYCSLDMNKFALWFTSKFVGFHKEFSFHYLDCDKLGVLPATFRIISVVAIWDCRKTHVWHYVVSVFEILMHSRDILISIHLINHFMIQIILLLFLLLNDLLFLNLFPMGFVLRQVWYCILA